jgi:diguanylate cyclase (GGDEF)-like protein
LKNLYKSIISILPPLILIIFGYIACTKVDTFSEQQLSIIFFAPYVVLCIVAVTAWKFNRSQSFFMSIIFILSLLIRFYQEKMPLSNDIYIILSVLLPFNLLIFTFLKERGIVSIWGMLRFGFILLQAGVTQWLLTPTQQELLNQLEKDHLPFHLNPVITITQIALLVFIVTFIALLFRIILYQASRDVFLLSVLIALFLLLNSDIAIEQSIHFTVIGTILMISIFKDTFFMAFFDDLTHLPSRRALNQDLMKLGMKYSIAMLDIDFFKKFNDSYGHDTGDEALKFIAAIIKDVKGGGKAYRYGGEEFTILFPGKNSIDVMSTLEDLRKTIASRGFVIRRKRRAKSSSKSNSNGKAKRGSSNSSVYKKIYIHVSIGVANKDETHRTSAMVLNAADSALYRAKKKGRNCVSK